MTLKELRVKINESPTLLVIVETGDSRIAVAKPALYYGGTSARMFLYVGPNQPEGVEALEVDLSPLYPVTGVKPLFTEYDSMEPEGLPAWLKQLWLIRQLKTIREDGMSPWKKGGLVRRMRRTGVNSSRWRGGRRRHRGEGGGESPSPLLKECLRVEAKSAFP